MARKKRYKPVYGVRVKFIGDPFDAYTGAFREAARLVCFLSPDLKTTVVETHFHRLFSSEYYYGNQKFEFTLALHQAQLDRLETFKWKKTVTITQFQPEMREP